MKNKIFKRKEYSKNLRFVKSVSADGSKLYVPYVIYMPMIRKVMPHLVASNIVGVQPLAGPTGSVFSIKATYSTSNLIQEFITYFYAIQDFLSAWPELDYYTRGPMTVIATAIMNNGSGNAFLDRDDVLRLVDKIDKQVLTFIRAHTTIHFDFMIRGIEFKYE